MEASEGLKPIESRHADIEYGEIDGAFIRDLQCDKPCFRGYNDVAAFLQRIGKDQAQTGLVVSD